MHQEKSCADSSTYPNYWDLVYGRDDDDDEGGGGSEEHGADEKEMNRIEEGEGNNDRRAWESNDDWRKKKEVVPVADDLPNNFGDSLIIEENFGESQNLFAPYYPDEL